MMKAPKKDFLEKEDDQTDRAVAKKLFQEREWTSDAE
jgi:hypothetical protein